MNALVMSGKYYTLFIAKSKCIYLELLWLFQFQFPTFVTFTFFKEVKKSERHKTSN